MQLECTCSCTLLNILQVAFADRILLKRCDLVPDEAELHDVEKAIRGINGAAEIIRTSYGKVDPKQLVSVQSFSLDRLFYMDPPR